MASPLLIVFGLVLSAWSLWLGQNWRDVVPGVFVAAMGVLVLRMTQSELRYGTHSMGLRLATIAVSWGALAWMYSLRG